jgi:hypothetical protein
MGTSRRADIGWLVCPQLSLFKLMAGGYQHNVAAHNNIPLHLLDMVMLCYTLGLVMGLSWVGRLLVEV